MASPGVGGARPDWAGAGLGSTLFSMLMRAEKRLVDIYVEAGATALHSPPPH